MIKIVNTISLDAYVVSWSTLKKILEWSLLPVPPATRGISPRAFVLELFGILITEALLIFLQFHPGSPSDIKRTPNCQQSSQKQDTVADNQA